MSTSVLNLEKNLVDIFSPGYPIFLSEVSTKDQFELRFGTYRPHIPGRKSVVEYNQSLLISFNIFLPKIQWYQKIWEVYLVLVQPMKIHSLVLMQYLIRNIGKPLTMTQNHLKFFKVCHKVHQEKVKTWTSLDGWKYNHAQNHFLLILFVVLLD